MTRITINGREVEADPKKPLVAACHEAGFDVPVYCYHPGLTPVGSCRICQVEVQQENMPPRVMVACKTPVAEGMVVDTESSRAHETRRECLEFLLKNHPLDCPICDKAGECDLQDFAFDEGQGEARTIEPRRKLEKRKSLGDKILLDEERCILCSRCVRFFEEVPKKPQLAVAGLGSRSMIATFGDRPLEGNYQGNIVDLCPVGALTLKKFRFQARVWNLRKVATTCGECSRGCAITMEVLRQNVVKRIRPRPDPEVNDWWICDVGRFHFDRYDEGGRIEGALARGSSGLVPVGRDEALGLCADTFASHEAVAVVASPWLTVEEGEALARLAERLGARPAFASPPPNDLGDDVLHTGDPCPNRRGLEELGFEALVPEEVLARLAESEVGLLVGERVAELVGRDALAALPPKLRVLLLDTHPLDAPAARVQIGVPTCAERSGHWINVDGVRRPLAPARQAPRGVAPTRSILGDLERRLEPAGAES